VSAPPEELPPEEVVGLFRECGALLQGHFLLSSGMHSPFYLQCARVLMEPARAMRVCAALLAKFRRELPAASIDAVVAPALGGVVLGYELARQLGVLALFVEREAGGFALRRGFTLEPGSRVLLAEDVVTTGLSSRECMACVSAAGAKVVAAVCLIDRSGARADLGVPLVALAELDLPIYPPDRIPPELTGQPAIKPGSRPAATDVKGRTDNAESCV
jgi:orotate phosphoribosyltransferase